MDERLKVAAEKGDIDMLYSLIREDPYVLDNIERIPFVDTPLHIAASLGHTGFARETMLLKPSFARKLNQDGFTPLHLALLNGQTKMVDRLVEADSDLVRVHGKEGKTPLHYAAEHGNTSLLKRFLLSCPSSILDVTNRGETALHIAVESKKFEAFRVVVVKMLVDNKVKLDAKNSDNLTALEILKLEDSQSQVNNREAREVMKKMLCRTRGSMSSSFFGWKSSHKSSSAPSISTSPANVTADLNTIGRAPASTKLSALNCKLDIAELEGQPQGNNVEANESPPPKQLFFKLRRPLERWAIDLTRGRNNLSEDSRNMMLVALVLVATIGFQCVLSPPGGLWQGDSNNSSATDHDNKKLPHPPGTVVMGDWSFIFFMLFNSLALALTAHAIIFLVLPDRRETQWWLYTRNLLATFISLCYLIALHAISPNASLFALVIVIAAIVFLVIPCFYTWMKVNLAHKNEIWMSHDAT
ncbi:Ankyrin repeat-containing protein [Morus notabilis]|uniref:Ankyrin repeat-containing protein n=1 Tax=Morus notabilis TaxID=981085 RepID=W9SDK5_9ROSA|nr:Ankyrin repeat-containing protein [Morus notabilis]